MNNRTAGMHIAVTGIVLALLGLLFLTVRAEGQNVQQQDVHASIFEPSFMDGAKKTCWELDPYCSPVAHASISVGFNAALDLTGLMDGDDARWIPLAFYGAKEVYDMSRFGFGDPVPAYDYALDFGGAVVGWWVSGLLFGE